VLFSIILSCAACGSSYEVMKLGRYPKPLIQI